jgi:SdrD B-like domain
VFKDTNRNGLLESNERGIPRARVRLTLANGQTLNAATDITGFYEFSGLPSGDIAVQVMATTTPTNGSTMRQFALDSAQQVNDVDFGFSPSAVKGVQLEADAKGDSTLAFTGSDSALRILGFALCLLGLGILLAPRRRTVVAKHKLR